MYASIDFATKRDFRQAVKQGATIVAYSPTMGMPAINGGAWVDGPWPIGMSAESDVSTIVRNRRLPTWKARVDVKDMRVVAVH